MDDDNSGADGYDGDMETLEPGFALGEQLQEEGRMYDLVQELTSGAAMDDSDKITKLNLCVRHPKVALCGAVAHGGFVVTQDRGDAGGSGDKLPQGAHAAVSSRRWVGCVGERPEVFVMVLTYVMPFRVRL